MAVSSKCRPYLVQPKPRGKVAPALHCWPATAYRAASSEFPVWALPSDQHYALSASLSIGEPPVPPLPCHRALTESNPELYPCFPNRPGVPMAADKPRCSVRLALNA
ncbi:hypothetical protein BDW71DRAFT_185057 [Aspergillus fruticulosus]